MADLLRALLEIIVNGLAELIADGFKKPARAFWFRVRGKKLKQAAKTQSAARRARRMARHQRRQQRK
ncbi:hypothetical protein G7A66_03975 [Altererythrobacter sp. SALINAS58]|uniref:hypothetical protein n=1 Tax=Alteripontixanthobacter muriae TaxID=2705546 RepID=UPI001575D93C|nr:hypothetical protein [Alteripontixanthobacter muriae]NTZ42265.1 hypothetical protein [Alteripontixanthobacter muriae]